MEEETRRLKDEAENNFKEETENQNEAQELIMVIEDQKLQLKNLQDRLDQAKSDQAQTIQTLKDEISAYKLKYEKAEQEAKAQVGELDKLKDNAFK